MARVAQRAGLRELYALLPPRRKRQLAAVTGLMLAGAVAELISIGAVLPFLQLIVDPASLMSVGAVRLIMERFGLTDASDLLIPATLVLIGAAVFAAAVRILLTWESQRFIYRLAYDFDTLIFKRAVRQPYSSYIQRNSSEILAGLEKVNNVTNFLLLPLMIGAAAAVIASFIIVLLFVIDPFTASAAAILMGGLYITISLFSRRILKWITVRWSALVPERTKAVQETLGGFREIVLDQSQRVFETRFERLDDEFRNLTVKGNFITAAPRFIVEGGGIALIGVMALYFSTQPGGVVAAIPVLGALAFGAQRLLPLVQSVYVGWSQYSTQAQALHEVIELMTTKVSAVEPRPKGAAVVPFRDCIEFQGVSFDYEAGAPALREIDLIIRKGERVGFVGRTGSGKSTLVDLLMGLLEPTAGHILLGGVPLSPHNLANWQAQIAHVPQSIFLADSSIATNIAFGEEEEDVDLERVRDAARGADIHAFIETLPQGYETTVGERGIRLSGGQRQRIGIARALYKKATVLVLDEATSALDDATEASIMRSIDALDRDLTVVLIAHRTSTLAKCDTIYALEAGRIAKRGTYAEVIADPVLAV